MDCFRADNAQTGPQRIDREIKQVPIAEAEKQALRLGNVLVDAENRLVVVPAHAGGNNVIVVNAGAGRLRKQIQECASRAILFAERNHVVGR